MRLKATEKFVTAQDEIEHFTKAGITGEWPQWVPWASYDQGTTAYLVLYKSATEFTPDTELLNASQLVKAVGWDHSADQFADGSFVGKTIQFRIEENTYEGKTTLRVNWVDDADATPGGAALKPVTADTVKAFNSKLHGYTKATAPVVVAKPAPAPACPRRCSCPGPGPGGNSGGTPGNHKAQESGPALSAEVGRRPFASG